MGLILKTGAILSGNVALTSDGVEEVRPPQWDHPVVLGSISNIYGTTSKLVIDGTEVTGGTVLFPSGVSNNSIWANEVVLGSISDIYGTTSKLALDGTEVTGGTRLFPSDEPNDSVWANEVVLGSISDIYGTTSKLALDGTEVTGGTRLFPSSEPNDSIWANEVALGSISNIYGSTSKLTLDGTEVTGGTRLFPSSEPNDSIWANEVALGSISNIYGSTSRLFLNYTQLSFSGSLESSHNIAEGETFSLSAAETDMAYHSTSFTVDKPTVMEMHLWGAGAGGSKSSSSERGGRGGYSTGTYTFEPNTQYHVVVGGGGEGGSQNPAVNSAYGADLTGGGRTGQNTTDPNDGAGGGGYTGIFVGSVSQESSLIIAGGGGGGSGETSGGGGGGVTGVDGGWYTSSLGIGGGGSQSSGGGGGDLDALDGSALQGGRGSSESSGGGGGYYGGGGAAVKEGGSPYLQSKGLTGSQGYTLYTNSVYKDMNSSTGRAIPSGFNPKGGSLTPTGTRYYWDDWGGDWFDHWGDFYIYSPVHGTASYIGFSNRNGSDGVIYEESQTHHSKSFTIKHGWTTQGIFKLDVECSDPLFNFSVGTWGNLGSDGSTQVTHSQRNESWGSMKVVRTSQGGSNEFFTTNIILKNTTDNTNKTSSIWHGISGSDNLAIYTPTITAGVLMYFVKGNTSNFWNASMYHWVSNDIQQSIGDMPKSAGGGSGYISPELTNASTSFYTTNTYYKDNAGLGGSSGQQGEGGLLVLRKLLETQ